MYPPILEGRSRHATVEELNDMSEDCQHVTPMRTLERALGSCPSELFLDIFIVTSATASALCLSAPGFDEESILSPTSRHGARQVIFASTTKERMRHAIDDLCCCTLVSGESLNLIMCRVRLCPCFNSFPVVSYPE